MEAGPLDRRRDAAAAARGAAAARAAAGMNRSRERGRDGRGGGANWAQVSGEPQQNVAIPYLPNTERPHWSGRIGHALCQSNLTSEGFPKYAATNLMFVLGGDDWLREEHPPYVGKGGGYLNDVWMTIDQKTGRWTSSRTRRATSCPSSRRRSIGERAAPSSSRARARARSRAHTRRARRVAPCRARALAPPRRRAGK